MGTEQHFSPHGFTELDRKLSWAQRGGKGCSLQRQTERRRRDAGGKQGCSPEKEQAQARKIAGARWSPVRENRRRGWKRQRH
jgi:hypothetical protein